MKAAINMPASFISVASNPGLVITDRITICMWQARLTNSDQQGGMISKANASQVQYFFGEGSGGGATNNIEFSYNEYGLPNVVSQWRTADNAYISDNAVDFMAVTYNYADSNSVRIYVNGTLQSGTWVANIPTGRGPTNVNILDLEVGTGRDISNPCSGANAWKGYYSEVAVWNSVLTFDQLELIRKSKVKGIQKQINSSTLRLYLPLDNLADGLIAIKVGTTGATEWPDRQNFGPFARRCNVGGASDQPIGRAEVVCSYQPNE